MALPDLDALEQELREHSHGDTPIRILNDAMKGVTLGDRQRFFNANMVCDPIEHSVAVIRMTTPPSQFHVLQGDVIRTEAAYSLGRRVDGTPSFVVATSTCDLVVGRRGNNGEPAIVTLLKIEPRRVASYPSQDKFKNDLGNLLSFKTKKYCYLPPLQDDDEDVLFNVVQMGAIAQLSNDALPAVERRASMTVIGWRVMGALIRTLQVREGAEEAALRIAVARMPYARKRSA